MIFAAEQARYVKEQRWHPSQELTELEDGRVRMTMEVSGTHDVLLWLLGHTGRFEVVAPAALQDEVRVRIEEGRKRHQRRSR